MCEINDLETEKTIRILKKEIEDLREEKEIQQKEIFKMNSECYDANRLIEDWKEKFKLGEKFFIELLKNDKLKKQNEELMKLLKVKEKITLDFK